MSSGILIGYYAKRFVIHPRRERRETVCYDYLGKDLVKHQVVAMMGNVKPVDEP